ncbi:hypothetical protein TrRE_jg1990, partial [Triparma retinervis]
MFASLSLIYTFLICLFLHDVKSTSSKSTSSTTSSSILSNSHQSNTIGTYDVAVYDDDEFDTASGDSNGGSSFINVPHLVVAGELTITSPPSSPPSAGTTPTSSSPQKATLARMDLSNLRWSPKHPTLYLYSSSHSQDTGTVYALMSNHTEAGKEKEKGGRKGKGKEKGQNHGRTRGGKKPPL